MTLVRVALTSLAILSLAACTDEHTTGSGGGPGSGDGDTSEVLYAGMGEYNPNQDWHAILRFDDADQIDSSADGAYVPDATIPVLETQASDGTGLNFAHGLYLVESRNEMYIASIFTSTTPVTNGTPEVDSGSVGVLASASSADGPQTLARHIFGDATQIKQPHGVWIDESRDLLYVANTFGASVLIFDNASSADGNVAPANSLSHESLGNPVFVYVDEGADRMFLASMNAVVGGGPQKRSAVNIYNNASSANGNQQPDVQIAGNNTRLDEGNNQTTHNVWFDSDRKLLLVGHHTNELLIYDLADVDLTPDEPAELDLTPRVLEVHEESDGSDIGNWSVYGFFLLEERDRLYVSCGHAEMGPSKGTPPNAIKVYDGLMDSGDSGLVAPDRAIHWSSSDTYYPPQPLWISAP